MVSGYRRSLQDGFEEFRGAGVIYGLVREIPAAGKIARSAEICRFQVHNFDTAERVIQAAKSKKPALIIADWDQCEAEAFKILKEIRGNADLNGVPLIGFAAGLKIDLKNEAERAGCHRVYTKTEFFRELDFIIARYRP